MSMDLGSLVGFIELDTTKFDKGLASAKGKFGTFAGKLGKVAAVGTAAAVTAVGAFAVSGVKQFGKFEKGMNEVFTLLPGISDKAMGDMSEDTRKFVREMGVAHEEAVPALYSALSAGVPKDNVFDFMETAQKVAMGGVTDLDTAVNGLTGVTNAYGEDVIDAGRASDIMFTTVKLGKTTVGELSQSLGDVTPLASAMGVSFEDVSAAMATSTKITGNTAKSTTGLKGLLSELGKEGQGAAKEFERISGKSFPDFIAGGGDLQGALQLMEEDTKKTGGSMVDLFGSVEAGQSALQLTGSNTESFSKALDEMEGSAGATDAAFEQMDQGLARSWDKIKIGVADAAIGFGDTLAPAVADASNWIADKLPTAMAAAGDAIAGVVDYLSTNVPRAVDAVSTSIQSAIDWFHKFQPAIQAVATVIGLVLLPAFVRMGVAALVSAAETAAVWLMYKVEAIKAGVVYVAQSALIMARWVAMGAAAIVSGVQTVAVWALYKAEAIKGAVVYMAQSARVAAAWVVMSGAAVASGIKTAAVWTGTVVAQAVKGAVSFAIQVGRVVAGWVLMGAQSLLQAARMAAAWLIAMGPVGWVIAAVIGLVAIVIANWDKISAWTKKAWTAVTDFVVGAWKNISKWTIDFLTSIGKWISDKFNAYLTLTKAVWGYIFDTIRNKWSDIKTAVLNALITVGRYVLDKFTDAKNTVSRIWGNILSFLGDTWEKIKSTVSKAIDWVKSILSTGLSNIKTNWSNAWNWVKTKASDIWDGIKTVVSDAWGKLKGTLTTLIDFVKSALPDAFEKAKDGVITAWDKIKNAAAKPVRFVVDQVIGGLVEAFWIIPGLDKNNLPKPKLPKDFGGYKDGGYTGDGAADEYAGPAHRGEYYFTKKQTAAIGKDKLAALAHGKIAGKDMSGNASVGSPVYGGEGSFSNGLQHRINRAGRLNVVDHGLPGIWQLRRAVDQWKGASRIAVNYGRGAGPEVDVRSANSPAWWSGMYWGADSDEISLNNNRTYPGHSLAVSTHEIGHALGLPHSMPSGAHSIMNYNNMYKHGSVTSADSAALRRIYGGSAGGGFKGSGGDFGDGDGPTNPFTGLIDKLMEKIKAKFPGAGMFVDAAGGIAKSAIDKAVKIVTDIQNGIKNIAGDVFDKIKSFFGGGAAMAPSGPAGMTPTLMDGGGWLRDTDGPMVVHQKKKPDAFTPFDEWKQIIEHAGGNGKGGDTYNVQLPEKASVGDLMDAVSFQQRRNARVGARR